MVFSSDMKKEMELVHRRDVMMIERRTKRWTSWRKNLTGTDQRKRRLTGLLFLCVKRRKSEK